MIFASILLSAIGSKRSPFFNRVRIAFAYQSRFQSYLLKQNCKPLVREQTPAPWHKYVDYQFRIAFLIRSFEPFKRLIQFVQPCII